MTSVQRSGGDTRTAVVVGGGPAGLSAATALRRATGARVIVLEREEHAGGIPRHTDHLGFGLRDERRLLRGPAYARRLVDTALAAGVDVRLSTTALHVDGRGATLATGERLDADAVIVATGVRERPRAARLVPGDRPAGVFTTGAIQQLTALAHLPVGRRAVVVGAEHVSFSAIWSLAHGGCTTVALVTPWSRHQSNAVLRLAATGRSRVPVRTGVDVARIVGHRRVERVELTDGTSIDCDTVVFTGDWVPDHELVRRAGVPILAVAKSPVVDAASHTAVAGLFATGNLVHPAETADLCALGGRRTAAAVSRWWAEGSNWSVPSAIETEHPVAWAAPYAAGITVRVAEVVTGSVEVWDGDRRVGRTRRRSFVPNRAVHVHVDASTSAGRPLRVRLVR